MRLATRLSLVTCLVTLTSGLATSLLVSFHAQKTLERRVLEDVRIVVAALAPQLAEAALANDLVVASEILDGLVLNAKGLGFAYLVDERGTVLAQALTTPAPAGPLGTPAPGPVSRRGLAASLRDRAGGFYLAGEFPLLEGAGLGSVHVGIDREIFVADIRRMRMLVVALSVVVAFAGVGVSVLAARRVARPLTQLTDSLAAFGAGRTSLPDVEAGGEEIEKLAAAFREMAVSRNRAEETLRFQKALLEAENETGLDGILIISPQRKVLYRNQRFLRMWSIPEELRADEDEGLLAAVRDKLADPEAFLEKVLYLYDHPEERSRDEVALRDGRVFDRYSASFSDPGGAPYGRIWFFRDISERRRAEEERLELERQLLHAQKLESLGVLAGGIAHDFNNILVAVMGNAEMALSRVARDSPAAENLRRIERAAARAADLANQMLAYSGRGRFLVERVDLNRLLEEMAHILDVAISKQAALRLELGGPLPAVEADATQIRQVVMNLVINASEALGELGGAITIRTGVVHCDQAYLEGARPETPAAEGRYVSLEVADTGCGMDADTLRRLFDPFFTTKFTGRGLGMPTVLGIVRGHRGTIKVSSAPGRGSSFTVALPVAADAAAAPAPPAAAERTEPEGGWRGSGTALLVDDEDEVRAVAAEMLGELGFGVVEARDGAEALEVFASRSDLELVILDLTMPRLDGERCLRELRARAPQVRVVVSSGFTEQEVRQRFAGETLVEFVQKPYTIGRLREVLRRALQTPARGA